MIKQIQETIVGTKPEMWQKRIGELLDRGHKVISLFPIKTMTYIESTEVVAVHIIYEPINQR